MKRNNEESKAYQNIIHNLLALKEEAVIAKPGEASAIEAILQSLFDLSEGLQLPAAGIHTSGQAGSAQDNGRGKILVHAH